MRLYRAGKASQLFGISKPTLIRKIKSGVIKAYRVGREHSISKSDDEKKTPEKELVEALLAIVTSFAGKLYEMRSHKKKRLVEAVKNALRDD
ncbi:MAG TPA: hypothetical protein ENG66_06350 [Thermococcus sp.]|nr:hypothetical protein [Thermococcus sp.]